MKKTACIFFILFLCCIKIQAQGLEVQFVYHVEKGDTIIEGYIPDIIIFKPLVFKNEKQRIVYSRLVRDVKIAYPYAKLVSNSIIETYNILQSLPNDQARAEHMKEVEKYMMDTYKPKLKQLTSKQGEILIKLINRESHSSSYDIVKALVGSFKASVYNIFAGVFGNSLKTEYDPNGNDKDIERIVVEIDQGVL